MARTRPNIRCRATAGEDVAGYVEVHIEQGPVLEAKNQPLGVVTGICRPEQPARHRDRRGRSRRHRADGAAPRCAGRRGRDGAGARGDRARASRGRHGRRPSAASRRSPGAVNIIPGTRDVHRRSALADRRAAAGGAEAFEAEAKRIAGKRGLFFSMETFHEIATAHCAPACRMGLLPRSRHSVTRRSGCRPAPATMHR